MTDISRLKVSLTKHNAHKISSLLKKYRASQILEKLDEVHAEEAQAHKNLSVQSGKKVPDVWAKAKKLGDSAIDALVLVGIIFSHHELIDAMINASGRSGFFGRIERDKQLSAKAYTNFVQIIDQLGYATKRDYDGVSFNLRGMFEIPGLGPLVGELLGYKLIAANWNGASTIIGEAVAQDFHKVFGITPKELKKWVSSDTQPEAAGTQLLAKDEEFFQTDNEGNATKAFEFRPGHEERPVEPINRTATARTKASRLHNDIQNRLYAYLKAKHGAANVGTEIDTGSGTAIDVATREKGKVTFYEIKTGKSVRASIRQAIPQLLEYAYWPDGNRADELAIVSHLPITKPAERYLNFLRARFNLPLSYRQFDMVRNTLV
jgi:hypothetical protein